MTDRLTVYSYDLKIATESDNPAYEVLSNAEFVKRIDAYIEDYPAFKVHIDLWQTPKSESDFLKIKKEWNAGSRTYTNSYIQDEDGSWFLDAACVITGSKSGLRRWDDLRSLLLDDQGDEIKPTANVFACSCGKQFASRQGLYKHVRKAGDYEAHRRC